MGNAISVFLVGIVTAITGLLILHKQLPVQNSAQSTSTTITSSQNTGSATQTTQKTYTDTELLTMADNRYANGVVPLGDNKYVTDAPKKGYIYLCHAQKDGQGGAGTYGPWISKTSWNFLNKTSVHGSITWSSATFSNVVAGASRTLSGNDLPINHTTGIFPIQSSDPAYTYDRNPNTISTQTLSDIVSAQPTYSDTPYCMGGEVGVMLSGVALFNGFDAGFRDAAAHELQDSCDGHPQVSGEYHYHSLSKCFKDISEKTVLGFALDGFPITGPMMAKDKYLTTDNLDECHGLTSEINLDGKLTITYHYVMTQDFPYSASCFRGKAIQPSGQNSGQVNNSTAGQNTSQQNNTTSGPTNKQPPQEATLACSGKTYGSNCSFTSPKGDVISGVCQSPQAGSLACVPNR